MLWFVFVAGNGCVTPGFTLKIYRDLFLGQQNVSLEIEPKRCLNQRDYDRTELLIGNEYRLEDEWRVVVDFRVAHACSNSPLGWSSDSKALVEFDQRGLSQTRQFSLS